MTTMAVDSSTTAADIAYIKSAISIKIDEDEKAEIRKWLYSDVTNSNSVLNFALSTRHPDTGNWFLESEEFKGWKSLKESSLGVYAIGMYFVFIVYNICSDFFSWKREDYTFVSNVGNIFRVSS
jgi:hypothetical protein